MCIRDRFLDASSGTDDAIQIVGGTNCSVTRDDDGKLTITSEDTTYGEFSGTTTGLVPASTSGEASKLLQSDGTWIDKPNATRLEFTTNLNAVSYTHLRAHETVLDLVCRLLLHLSLIHI